MREGLLIIKQKLLLAMEKLADFADEYKSLPTLGFTHFQPAQLTTVGKRACLWLGDLLLDLDEVEHRIKSLKLLGSKGRRARRRASWSCLTATTKKSKGWIG
jgi:adenylosuccinate lyase